MTHPTDHYSPLLTTVVGRILVPVIYGVKYKLKYKRQEPLPSGSLIIANHQRFDDIPLLCQYWRKTQNRIPHYIMRQNLPDVYLKIGGIPVWRSQEAREHAKTLPKDKRREFLESITTKNNEAFEHTVHCLSQGQDVVLFPSGSRHNTELHTQGVEEIVTKYIQKYGSLRVIPIAITYQKRILRQQANISQGEIVECSKKDHAAQAISELESMINQSA